MCHGLLVKFKMTTCGVGSLLLSSMCSVDKLRPSVLQGKHHYVLRHLAEPRAFLDNEKFKYISIWIPGF